MVSNDKFWRLTVYEIGNLISKFEPSDKSLITTCCRITYTASAEPPTKVSASTVIVELGVSIFKIWSLTGTTSLELGVTVNSITVERL